MASKFGEKIRNLREQKGLLLREVAPLLNIDTPQLSKIERGERQAKKEFIEIFAQVLDIDIDSLLKLWLADQMYSIIKEEPLAKEAIEELTNVFNESK
ncbi:MULTISPECIES: helix-turn-helix domain-containing protein [Bacteroidota]|uniref:Helix-turn-helix n=2 Tax=Bacteroidota TaxID=976 RepID=A0A1I4X5N6_9FLAO|nr:MULTISPECIES: helix-turn-helix transcriptional regulator [Bacteroidota]MDM1047230.1 helix-turn-helix transcriptional regulator [Sphingobacterium hotanense]SFN20992.1 Helix-turn-helix [Paenimyroides ummariense]